MRSDINYSIKPESMNDNELEVVLLDVYLPKMKPMIVGMCYRPPTQYSFYDSLEALFNRCEGSGSEYYLLGDFNTNVKDKNCCSYAAYLNFCKQWGLSQLINEVTRLKTQTTIDLILVSDESNIAHSGVIKYGISDHYIIHCTRKKPKVCID